MRTVSRLVTTVGAILLAGAAPAAVRYDISGLWNFTINGHNYTNVQMDLVGIGTGASHSVTINTPGGLLTVQEYDLSSLFGYASNLTVNFGSSYSFETTTYQPGVGAVAFGNAEADESIYATSINGIYDGVTTPFSANGVDTLSDDEVMTALNNQFEITSASNVIFSASTVPEPAGWTMMIGGFGAIGMALRRSGRRARA